MVMMELLLGLRFALLGGVERLYGGVHSWGRLFLKMELRYTDFDAWTLYVDGNRMENIQFLFLKYEILDMISAK